MIGITPYQSRIYPRISGQIALVLELVPQALRQCAPNAFCYWPWVRRQRYALAADNF